VIRNQVDAIPALRIASNAYLCHSMIRQSTIDQIFSAASIEEVVADYVKLKRSGSGLGGLCPFHNEKSPSFKVSPALGIYKCFGCSRGGNVIDFVMEIEKMNYPEALKHLAGKYSIEVEEDKVVSEEANAQLQTREALYIALEYARKAFHSNLIDDEDGKAVGLSYFKHRGLTDQTIENFQLGYAKKSWDDFTTKAISAGYDPSILEKSGLIKRRGEEKEGEEAKEASFYDAYRDRVIFPISNIAGKVVGFGGRQLQKEDKSPKYINSPENDVYHKSSVLYGLYQARKAVRTLDNAYLVEGYLDVIMLFQSGIENVVATSGTALTEDQVRLVKRFTENVTLLYDGDKAGIKAAIRGVDLLLEGGLNVKVVVFPDGEDPDSYCRKLGGTAFEAYINEHKADFVTFKTEHLLEEKGKDAIGISETAREVVQSVIRIPDPIKRNAYLRQTASLLQFDVELLLAEAQKQRAELNKRSRFAPEQKEQQHPLLGYDPTKATELLPAQVIDKESSLIKTLISYSSEPYSDDMDVAGFIFSELESDGYTFENPDYTDLIEEAKAYYKVHKSVDEQFFARHPTFGKLAAEVFSIKYDLSPSWWEDHEIHVKLDSENYREEIIANLNYLKLFKIDTYLNKALEELKSSESAEDQVIAQSKYHQIMEIKKSIIQTLGIDGAYPST
jgi:DNA primase